MAGQSKTLHIPKASTYGGLAKHFVTACAATTGGRVLASVWLGGVVISIVMAYRRKQDKAAEARAAKASMSAVELRDAHAKLKREGMWEQMKIILPFAFKNMSGRPMVFLVGYTALLIARILLTIKIASVTGTLGKMIGARTFTEMFQLQVVFGLWCLPAAIVNAGLHFSRDHLALAMRGEIVKSIHDQYLRSLVYYRATNVGRVEIDDIDTRSTQDLKKFCSQLAQLYGSILKPVLEVFLISRSLSKLMGGKELLSFFVFFFMAGQWLRFIMPPFARLTSETQQIEGEFRSHHTRIINHAEEIAFYQGANREKVIINSAYDRIRRILSKQYWLSAIMGILDAYAVKYGASMMAYSMLIPAVYLGRQGLKGKSTAEVMEYYLTATQLFVALGTACKSLVLSYRRIYALAGLTSRVSGLLTMLKKRGGRGGDDEGEVEMMRLARAHPEVCPVKPKVSEGDEINFKDVDLFSPTGALLVKRLNFTVSRNTNVLVSGPNGSGKSSLFRVLGGLWPLCSGEMVKPPKSQLFYVPQKPYLAPGSLRDEVTYPKSFNNSSEDGKLDELMEMVGLSYLAEREGGWGAVRDWADVLSGGEKQRVAMARLFYHKPLFGILDECTSAVSKDVEGKIYENCKRLGITIFTVSHRPQLAHHHDYELRFDGEGGWDWINLKAE